MTKNQIELNFQKLFTTSLTDEDFLRIAYKCAKWLSDDTNTKNGAVLATRSGDYIPGANHFPDGVEVTPERLDRSCKLDYMIHAEADVIFEAARRGVSTLGATLYCPYAACCNCAQAIVAAGITRVVSHKGIHDLTPERWQKSINIGHKMFEEAGVEYVQLDCELGIEHLFSGEMVKL